MRKSSCLGIAIVALAMMAFAGSDAEGHGRLLGRIFFGGRCAPTVVQPCAPFPNVPAPVAETPVERPLPKLSDDLPTNVKNIAALLKEGDADRARRLAKLVSPTFDDISDLEILYKPRNKGGLGWGSKVRTNPATDGLGKGASEFAKNVKASEAKQTEVNVEAAYWIAAIAEVARTRPVKGIKVWVESADAVRAASLDLAKASAAGDAAEMKAAAARIDAACLSCHAAFK